VNLRGLLSTALLLAIPALVQPGSSQAASAPLAASADATLPAIRVECTPASRASELLGKHGCVAGRVFRVTSTKRGDTHLSLCPSRSGGKCSFHVVTKAGDSSSVGDLAYLRGKIVAVVGDVTEYHGHPAILVRDKQQLQVAANDAPQEFDAAQPRPRGKGFPGSRSGRAW
jgi:hypothetical protein